MKKVVIVLSVLLTLSFSEIVTAQVTAKLKGKTIDSFTVKSHAMLKNTELEDKFELAEGTIKIKSIHGIKDAILEKLNVAVADSRFLQVDAEGKVSGLFGKIEAKTKTVQIYIDFGRYMNSTDKDGREEKIGYLMRLEAEITNFDVNADISSLFAVGFAAKTGKIQGKVKITTIGLSGTNLDQYVTNATSISEDSLLKAIENLAVLKSKIKTDEITINPDKLPIGI